MTERQSPAKKPVGEIWRTFHFFRQNARALFSFPRLNPFLARQCNHRRESLSMLLRRVKESAGERVEERMVP